MRQNDLVNPRRGYYLIILFAAIFNTSSRLAAGYLFDKCRRMSILLMVFLLQAFNLMLFVNYVTPILLASGTVFTGLCYGAFFALLPLATAVFFGVTNFGINYGLIFLAWGFVGMILNNDS